MCLVIDGLGGALEGGREGSRLTLDFCLAN